MTKVSIIVPVYNPAGEYLKKCIDSLVEQTLENIEIIVVDNGSINDNPQICKEYSERYKNIKLIKLKQNVGFAKAVNEAFKIAEGEYIQIVDSDDWIEKETCENLYNKAKKYNSDLIIFGATQYNQKNKCYEDTPIYSLRSIPNKYMHKTFSFKEGYEFLFYTPLQDWNKFVHRDLVYNYDNFMCERLPYVFADCVYSAKNFVNAKNIICDKEKYYKYRINISSSVVKGYSKKDCLYLDAPFIVAEEFEQIARSVKDNKLLYGFVVENIGHIFGYYNLAHKDNKKLVYQMMQNYFRNLDKDIYTDENMKKFDRYRQKLIKKIRRYPYWLFNLINFVYQKTNDNNVIRVKIFRTTIFKKYTVNNYWIRKYFGMLKIKSINMDAYSAHIIHSIISNVSDLFDEKLSESNFQIFESRTAVEREREREREDSN